MSLAVRANFETQKAIGFADIGGAYTAIGTAFDNTVRILFVDNFTDVPLQFSLDGVTDHFVVWGPGAKAVDISTNKNASPDEFYVPRLVTVYVKTIEVGQVAPWGGPTSGAVFVSTVYGETR